MFSAKANIFHTPASCFTAQVNELAGTLMFNVLGFIVVQNLSPCSFVSFCEFIKGQIL